MRTADRGFSGAMMAARSAAAMALGVGRATGRPDMAAAYAFQALTRRGSAVSLVWKGLRLAARPADWHAIREVLIEAEYAALAPYLAHRPEPVVLDIGANIGTFGLYALSVAPGAKVQSLEPSQATFALLDATCRSNPRHRWQAHRAAAWSEDGKVSFANEAASTAGKVSADGDEQVPALSLASILSLCGGRADVAKIDVEGAEEALLCDRAAELAMIDTVCVELHPGRCDVARVTAALRRSHGPLYAISGRRSSKPLLLATRSPRRPDLPLYES
ncbi:MAG: FkbM family methyltransferase [Hyphomicrobiaceae bacterium]